MILRIILINLQSATKMKSIKTTFILAFILLITETCSSSVEPDVLHSIQEIKKNAKNGQIVKSQGVLTERTAKREFIVEDKEASIKVNLGTFKKKSKYLDKNTRIIFSGKYRKRFLYRPVIDIEFLQVVDEFK